MYVGVGGVIDCVCNCGGNFGDVDFVDVVCVYWGVWVGDVGLDYVDCWYVEMYRYMM